MPVPLIPCRNTVTGAVAEIPETALDHMTDWQRLDTADAGDETDDPATGQSAAQHPADLTSDPAPPAADDDTAPAGTTRKSKAAKAATSTKED